MKKESKGEMSMRGFPMPKDKREQDQGQLNPACGLKYATEFGNPKDLDKSTKGLSDYVKNNQMKY